MTLHLAHPLYLLLLVALAAVALARTAARSRDTRSSQRARRFGAAAVAMGVAPVLVVFALAGPQVNAHPQPPTVLAVDESASVSAQGRAVERRWIRGAADDDCVDPCRVVRFSAAAGVTAARARRGTDGNLGDVEVTDVQTALQTAIGLTPDGGRVVLLSDGGQTRGDLLAAAPAARARDVRVDWVRLPPSERPDAAITAASVPATVRRGDPVPLTLTVHSNVAGTALLRVRSGTAKPRRQRVHLAIGDNPLLLFYTADRRGWQSFKVTVSLPGDVQPKNDSQWVATDVLAAPRVLMVQDGSSPLRSILAHAGLRTTSASPASLPDASSGYRKLDAVVLGDVPATRMTRGQIAALSDAVRVGGLGLFVAGGPHSLSLGRYAKSGLQRLLPVSSLVPGNLQRRNVAIELVLDRSGSMIDKAGGVRKITMTRVAAASSASFIARHKDQLGVVDFDTAAHILVPLRRLSSSAQEKAVDQRVDGLRASGGTTIFRGLDVGYEQLLKSSAPERHIILMTDGISNAANYRPLLAKLRAAHISVATVALGADADRNLLSRIADGTGGRKYATDNARQLPKIFAKETQLSAKPVRVRGRLSVSASGDSAIVRSLIGTTLPALTGNVVTQLKHGAQADLLASDAKGRTDPALAEWQLGAGRVVTWTPGIGAPWARAWNGERALWNDAVRWVQRSTTAPVLIPRPLPGAAGTLQIDLAPAGTADVAVSGITGTLTDQGGFSLPVDFASAGSGLFQANVSSFPPGVYRYTLATQGAHVQTATGAVAIPYPAEYSPVSNETSPVSQLVAQTDGTLLRADQEGAIQASSGSLRRLLTLLALVVFCVGLGVRMLSGLLRDDGRSRSGRVGRAGWPAQHAASVARHDLAQSARGISSDSESPISSSAVSGSTEVDNGR